MFAMHRVAGARLLAYWLVATAPSGQQVYIGMVWQPLTGPWVAVRFGDGATVTAGSSMVAARRLAVLPVLRRTPRLPRLRLWWVKRRYAGPALNVVSWQALNLKLTGAAYARFVCNGARACFVVSAR